MLREDILDKVKKYYTETFIKSNFIAGISRINFAGRVFDEKELTNLVDSALDFWLTEGRYTTEFERKLCKYLGVNYATIVNSGSSANLLAISALTSKKLNNRRLNPNDEIITTAASFPTTVTPIIQNRCIPVFLDIELDTYNIDTSPLENAITNKTKAIFLAHTMGNPFNIKKIKELCNTYNLWLIEDNCDSLGSLYDYKHTGTFGDISTCSFFPAHHITTGEGGAVIVNDKELEDIIHSFKHWGSACSCPPGTDNKCGKRFSQKIGNLPEGYDHKYTYTHLGYNLKVTEMQSSIGCAQMDKLNDFTKMRRENHKILYDGLSDLDNIFILPKEQKHSIPSWYSFVLTIRDGTKFSRNTIIRNLEKRNIQTRLMFTGNITRHPCMDEVLYRVIGKLENTDKIMNDSFMIGVYPGMTEDMLNYVIQSIRREVL